MDDLPLHSLTQALLDQIPQHPKGSYVLHGLAGMGKRQAALQLAQRLNCLGDEQGQCRHCLAIEHGNFPDLWVSEQNDEQIKIEHVRSMVSALGLAPYYAQGHRVFILDATSGITAEAQNALLKAFEEPPPRTIIVLLASALDQLLLTVRSRCEAIYFALPSVGQTAKWLASQGVSAGDAERFAALAGGRPVLARQLSQDAELQEAYAAAQSGADQLLAPSLFERLMAAKRLAEQKPVIDLVAGRLSDRLRTSLRQPTASTPAAVAQGLAALERFRQQLHANVTPKAALEYLALELPR